MRDVEVILGMREIWISSVSTEEVANSSLEGEEKSVERGAGVETVSSSLRFLSLLAGILYEKGGEFEKFEGGKNLP